MNTDITDKIQLTMERGFLGNGGQFGADRERDKEKYARAVMD